MSTETLKMKEIDKVMTIDLSLDSKKYVKIYFDDPRRSPIYGIFVRLEDYNEKMEKGMIRFVADYKVESFNQSGIRQKVLATKLYMISDFSFIKIC